METMNQQEMELRKACWDALTELEKKEIEDEKKEIIQWAIKNKDKFIEKLKAEGRWRGGLDGIYPELEDIKLQYKKQLQELLKKYGIDLVFN